MGARQSSGGSSSSNSSPASDGRTRGSSGSEAPAESGGGGGSSSSNGGTSSRAGRGSGLGTSAAVAVRYGSYAPDAHHHHHYHHHHHHHNQAQVAAAEAPQQQPHSLGSRTRSMGEGASGLGGGPSGARAHSLNQSSFSIPTSIVGTLSSQDSGSSTPEELNRERAGAGTPRLLIGSLPSHLSPHLFGGFKCPVCSKFIPTDEMDLHLVMCLTKPRITYNEDVLSKDAGECAICLEELLQGDTIARLPCLCIYHKGCIDEWFEVNRSCPEHPSD
ncbi:E3 ubiquitin-protein ligase ZNRF2 [Microcaecilia unicolor]|uniref:RING-type E3 ubiquitin transferase n=1 Tax=Microcaecilia unicolor TaxID=1415580 RepID=A0A6P7YGR9_9AMPH|nr:E3 ubiquitin-protein ligase ZNRF2 [Microcaecilia unicolor]